MTNVVEQKAGFWREDTGLEHFLHAEGDPKEPATYLLGLIQECLEPFWQSNENTSGR